MELRLQFVGSDGVPRRSFTLPAQDGHYQLPRLVTVATGDVWIEDATIQSCDVPPGAQELRTELLAAWDGNGPSGHGTRLWSPVSSLLVQHVTRPAEVRVTWAVSWYSTGLYERYLNSADAFLEEASVTLNFEPPPRPEPEQALVEEPERASADWGHRGHVAIDYGTSYCTATLFEQEYLPPARPLSSLQARQLRKDLVSLLDRGPGARLSGSARREFADHAAEIAASLLSDSTRLREDQLAQALRRALTDEDDQDPQFLYKVMLELELRLPQTSDALRPPLAAALNQLYTQAWRVPPLDRLRLFEVMLDPGKGSLLESTATATAGPPLNVRLGGATDDDDDENVGAYVYAGLKQRLAKAVPHDELGTGMTSDDLIQESLRYLVGRCNAFVSSGAQELGTGSINHVVATFPTMATPAVRHKLRGMLEAIGIRLIDNTLDEAIAAAMFTVLRDFGSDYDTGLELLRAQSRQVDKDKGWKQNLLVIDIGGGTTDIALLGLHLRDETPEEAVRIAPATHGRYYELRPEVLGSTGRPQLGGELMSLRVFYWVKALLADQLLRLFPDSFARSRADLRQLVGETPGDGVLLAKTWRKLPTRDTDRQIHAAFDILNAVVPTRSAPDSTRPSQAFWQLWRIADRVKLDFCKPQAPQQIPLRPAELRRLLQRAWSGATDIVPDVQRISDDDLAIMLAAHDFERLVAGDLDEIMDLAYQLARQRLAGSAETAEPVDRVILTGQASRAPQVRSRLLSVFSDQKDVAWQPKSVSVEAGDFAKLATSLGACWTRVNRQLVPDPDGAVEYLASGRNEFHIDVDNLFFNLPCAFLLGTMPGGASDDARSILEIGTELFQVYPDEDLAVVRSAEFPLTGYVNIFRAAQGSRPRWADFQWEIEDKTQKLDLDPGVWAREIKAVLETTSNLDMHLLLSRGPRHYAVGGESNSVRGAVSAANAAGRGEVPNQEQQAQAATTPEDVDAVPRFDPSRIVVNAYSLGSDHQGAQVFPLADGQAEPAALTETFHVADRTGGETTLDGLISARLPDPPASGRWTFHYRDDKGGLHRIGEHTPPRRTGNLAIRYYASVDAAGDIRVHAGAVPFWAANSLAEVQNKQGSVYRAEMNSDFDDYQPGRDPFNGRH